MAALREVGAKIKGPHLAGLEDQHRNRRVGASPGWRLRVRRKRKETGLLVATKPVSVDAARKPGNGLPIRYTLVLWLLVLSAVAFLDRTNIAIAGVQIGKAFKIDNAHLGWVFSAFLSVIRLFSNPWWSPCAANRPAPVCSTLSLTWWGISITLTALVPSTMRGAPHRPVMALVFARRREATMFPANELLRSSAGFLLRSEARQTESSSAVWALDPVWRHRWRQRSYCAYGWHVLFFGSERWACWPERSGM